MNTNEYGFHSTLSYGYVRVASITPTVVLGNPTRNAINHIESINEAHRLGAMVIVGPEMGLTGYTIGDTVENETLVESSHKALKSVVNATKEINSIVVVGMPLEAEGYKYNVAVVILRGKILAVVPKSYLPKEQEFIEGRWYRSGFDANITSVQLFGEDIPFGIDILIDGVDMPGFLNSL